MSTQLTSHRAWQRFLVFAPLALCLLARSAPAADTSEEADLKIVQGLWEREEPSDSKASYKKATKQIDGNKEMVTYYDAGGKVVRRHNVEFSLSRMGDVKIFTYRQMEITDGPDKGTKNPGPVSYVYWANDKFFREVWGFLPGQEAPPVVLYVWKRAGGERGEAAVAAAREKADAAMQIDGRWRAVTSERGGNQESEEQTRRHRLIFSGGTFTIERDDQMLMRGKYRLDTSSKPAAIDMTIEEHADRPEQVGKVVRGIIEQSGDELKWCIAPPDRGERPKEFSTNAGEEQMSVVLKREKQE